MFYFLRRLFSSWHALLAGGISLGVYLIAPIVVRWFDPAAGAFDGGYLVWVFLATFVTFWAVFVGWAVWQLAFALLDRMTSSPAGEWGELEAWFAAMSPAQRFWAVQGTFIFCIAAFIYILQLIPVS